MPPLSDWASGFLVAFYVFSSVTLLVLIGFAAWSVWKLHSMLEKYEARINPVIDKADQVLTLIGEKVDTIGGKAESILTQGEEMAESVHEKVDRTATTVQRTINAPIIKANSLAAAFTQGLATFARLQQRSNGGPSNGNRYHNTVALEPLPEDAAVTGESSFLGSTDTLNEVSEPTTAPVTPVVVSAQTEQTPLILGRKG
jgi:hypothetical protein